MRENGTEISWKGKKVTCTNGIKNRPCINPLLRSISMHVLRNVLFTSLKVLTRRICLTIKSFF